MPTKKKRVGFIPREDVMRIIEKLSTENNISNSKIISILVEEALSIRGIFDKKNVKFVANSSKLLKELQKISGVLSTNNTLPILDSFLLSLIYFCIQKVNLDQNLI